MAINGKGLSILGIGTIFVMSGLRGWSVLGTAQDLIMGVKPSGTQTNPITFSSSGSGQGVPDAGVAPGDVSGLAGIAMQYQGHGYGFAGAPGPDGKWLWDCSSFVNFCVGVRMKHAIPGYGPGKYDGNVHGPATGQWAIWNGLTTVPSGQVQAGDLACWTGHIGICISATQMISALNAREGTKVTSNDKSVGSGAFVRFGRLT